MSKYNSGTGIEGEYEPGSRGRVLRNLKRITSVRAMHETEHDLLLLAQFRSIKYIEDTSRFTAKMIRAMHKDWLESIYPWAGNYRTVEMAKAGFRWPPAHRVPSNMAALESGLLQRHTPCLRVPLETVAARVAVHAELLLIHPFREGNGRMARWLADLMISQAGFPGPDYGFEGKGARAQRAKYLHAVIAGYALDLTPLTDFFAAAILRRLAGEAP